MKIIKRGIFFISLLLYVYIAYLAFSFYSYHKVLMCPVPKSGGNKELHSQFFEDFILSIVFKDIKKGSYIDVGANDPESNSVTKYFYLKGWRGINIEPLKHHYLALLKQRPEDINLNIGISDHRGTLSLAVISIDGLSTFDQEALDTAIKDGAGYKIIQTPVKPLNDVLKEHPMPIIHFMTIDVEGLEKQVLSSIDLSKHRPWVLVVEAVKPGRFTRTDDKWKEILLQNDYIYAMFDGLNVYYIAKEHFNNLDTSFAKAYQCVSKSMSFYRYFNDAIEFGYPQ